MAPVEDPGEVAPVVEDAAATLEEVTGRQGQTAKAAEAPQSPADRKPRRHATTTAEDIAIFKAVADLRPQFAERGLHTARWEEVADRVNDEVGTDDISDDLCKRRYENLIKQVLHRHTIPTVEKPPFDDKLHLLVLEAIREEKKHTKEEEATRARQRQEYEAVVRCELAQSAPVPGMNEEASSPPPETVNVECASREQSGESGSVETPPRASPTNLLAKVRKVCARLVHAVETKFMTRLTQMQQRFHAEQRRAEERAAQEISALREATRICANGQAKHIERLVFQSQAQHHVLVRLYAASKEEQAQREELQAQVEQLKSELKQCQEGMQRERSEMHETMRRERSEMHEAAQGEMAALVENGVRTMQDHGAIRASTAGTNVRERWPVGDPHDTVLVLCVEL